jgi:hypothetical protein
MGCWMILKRQLIRRAWGALKAPRPPDCEIISLNIFSYRGFQTFRPNGPEDQTND